MRASIWGVFAIVFAVGFCRANSIVIGINDGDTPIAQTWAYQNVGWFFTPQNVNFTLTGIRTEFSSVASTPREIGIIIYKGDPTNSLNEIEGAGFTSAGGTFNGADFNQPFELFAGHTYFVGFTLINDMGMNVTADPNAVSLSSTGQEVSMSLGDMRYSNANEFPLFSHEIPGGTTSAPILEFLGKDVEIAPLPKTLYGCLAMLCLGGALKLRKRRLNA